MPLCSFSFPITELIPSACVALTGSATHNAPLHSSSQNGSPCTKTLPCSAVNTKPGTPCPHLSRQTRNLSRHVGSFHLFNDGSRAQWCTCHVLLRLYGHPCEWRPRPPFDFLNYFFKPTEKPPGINQSGFGTVLRHS